MNNKSQTLKYVVSDFLSSSVAWGGFYTYRKLYIESTKYGYKILEYDFKFFLGLIIIPLFWLLFYYSRGHYSNVFKKSRLQELGETLLASLFGVIILFFALILDDTIVSYKSYYLSFSVLLVLHFVLTYVPRFVITNATISKIRNRTIGFNTLLIGSNERALRLYKEIESQPKSTGYKFVGFIKINGNHPEILNEHLTCLGSYDDLKKVIREHNIEEVIIAIETSEHDKIDKILNVVFQTNVTIKVIPSMYDIMTSTVQISNLYGQPLLEVSHILMPAFQENLKRMIDVTASFCAMVLLSPLYAFLAVGVRLSSKGPIFYSQERIGRYGKPFLIYKFRSMIPDAEQEGPALSSDNDPRVTKFGRFMRKSRLDELPQFFNVLKGEMSLVGPRPERLYYIERIVEKAPQYYHLLKIRPGITSWGQVKFGYAQTVEEMIERMYYDLIYIENMSLYVDFKILIYTIKIVFKGVGK